MTDQFLVTQVVVLGSRRAFDELTRRHQSPLRRFLRNLTGGDEMLADDLAQETLIKAWTSLKSFQNRSSYETWLFRIAYNVFYDYIRSRKETVALEGIEGEIDRMYRQNADDGSLRSDISQALKQLSANERTCILLFFMEETKISDISQITGMPEGTVKSHIARGKEKMSNYLRQNGYGR